MRSGAAISLVLKWLLVVFWLALIVHFSNQPFKAQDLTPKIQRQQRLVRLVAALPHVSFRYAGTVIDNRRNPAQFIQFWIRKAAHVFLYGMLGASLLGALAGSGIADWRGWATGVPSVLMVAILDERNQALRLGRTGCPEDVAVDMFGFLVFALMSRNGVYLRRLWSKSDNAANTNSRS